MTAGDAILVTGGAGFIGSNFVRAALAQTAARVVVVDKLTYAGNRASLSDVAREPRFTFVRADIADRTAIGELVSAHAPTWVVNFAAETHVDRSIDAPRAFLHTNVIGTFELLAASLAHFRKLDAEGRHAFRFLHVSTDEVYGTLTGPGRFTEASPHLPNSPYAASKAAGDHFVRAYHQTYGLPALITNCSNNYGPYQFPEKLIPLTTLNAIEGKPLPLYGDGLQSRDWLYVDDHCAAILLALQRGRPGETYNVGGDNELTNTAVVDRICAILEELQPAAGNPSLAAQGVKRYEALKTLVTDRPAHDRRYAIDAAKIRRELGWQPRTDFVAGLRRTIQWYLEQREWCAEVQAGVYGRERLGLGGGES